MGVLTLASTLSEQVRGVRTRDQRATSARQTRDVRDTCKPSARSIARGVYLRSFPVGCLANTHCKSNTRSTAFSQRSPRKPGELRSSRGPDVTGRGKGRFQLKFDLTGNQRVDEMARFTVVWWLALVMTSRCCVLAATEPRALQGSSGEVFSVAFSPDGKALAAGYAAGVVRLWNVRTGGSSATFLTKDPVGSVAFCPDGKFLASDDTCDGTIRLWDVGAQRAVATLRAVHAPTTDPAVMFSPDGKVLAYVGYRNTIMLWDVLGKKDLGVLRGRQENFTCLAFNPQGKTLVAGSDENIVTVWDLSTREAVAILRGHTAPLYCVAFNRGGTLLASGGDDKDVHLWDMPSGKRITTLPGHSDRIVCVAFSPDQTLLASASFDHTIRLWDLKTRKLITTLSAHSGPVFTVAFSPDGATLASGGADGTIRLWRTSKGVGSRFY